MRRNVIWSTTWILCMVGVTLLTTQCGKSKDQDDDDDGDDGNPALVPADWDGKSDWSGSSLEVIEE